MSNPQAPVYVHQAGLLCSLGGDTDTVAAALFDPPPEALVFNDAYSPANPVPLGAVAASLPSLAPGSDNSRNNQLLLAAARQLQDAIEQARARFGPRRIGVVIGTSTSGISEGERAFRQRHEQGALPPGYSYRQQEISSPARFLSGELQLQGPSWVVSTACTSGSKALLSAARLLQTGACDAVVAGGVDTLCRMTLAGFSSLQLVSTQVCNPFSANRSGINIGEAGALFLLSREPGAVRLAGWGETSDAHHISAPHPEGAGAAAAMQAALTQAGLQAEDIGYVNLHGTGTPQNDKMEALAMQRVFGELPVACSSTKALTGHTLGAAGALEAAFCWLTLQRSDGRLPPHRWDGARDPELAPLPGLGREQSGGGVYTAMSNSFAFGGNNTSLIFSTT